MKIRIIFFIILFFLLTMSLITVTEAEPGVSISISVTISTSEIILGPNPFPKYVEMLKIKHNSQNVSSNYLTIQNLGFNAIRLNLSVQDIHTAEPTMTPWVYSETDFSQPLDDYHFRLAGIFTNNIRTVRLSDFSNDDIFLKTGRTCTAQAYAFDTENNKYKGFNIGHDETRSLFFRLDLPEKGTDGELAVTINVTAVPN